MRPISAKPFPSQSRGAINSEITMPDFQSDNGSANVMMKKQASLQVRDFG